jgi:DNA-binding transcriptional regulator YiaG
MATNKNRTKMAIFLNSELGEQLISTWQDGELTKAQLADRFNISHKQVCSAILAYRRRNPEDYNRTNPLLERKRELKEKLPELVSKGKSYEELLEESGATVHLLKSAGLSSKKDKAESDRNIEIVRRVRLGLSQNKVAMQLGIARQTVHKICKRNGLTQKRRVYKELEQLVFEYENRNRKH